MQCSKSIHMGNEIKKELSCLYISKGDTVYYIHTLNSGIDVGPTTVGTVVCIKVRTASFPRFWKNHP